MAEKNTILHVGGFLPCNFWEGEGGFKYIYIYIKGEHVPIELVMKLN
jgi:hypothetical protein